MALAASFIRSSATVRLAFETNLLHRTKRRVGAKGRGKGKPRNARLYIAARRYLARGRNRCPLGTPLQGLSALAPDQRAASVWNPASQGSAFPGTLAKPCAGLIPPAHCRAWTGTQGAFAPRIGPVKGMAALPIPTRPFALKTGLCRPLTRTVTYRLHSVSFSPICLVDLPPRTQARPHGKWA